MDPLSHRTAGLDACYSGLADSEHGTPRYAANLAAIGIMNAPTEEESRRVADQHLRLYAFRLV